MRKYAKYLNSNEWEFIPYTKMQNGGNVDDYNTTYNGMNPSVEVERGETVKLPNGLIDVVNSGGKHSEITNGSYGTPMNLPMNSKIFSEKLKNPTTKKSYAREAKKFETKKDLENLDSQYSDYINKNTANLNIDLKNQATDALFMEQENNKLLGLHNKEIQRSTIEEYKKKYGGKTKAADGQKVDNNPPLSGTKGIGEDLFSGDLDSVYRHALLRGYKGTKDITELQNWAATNFPREVSDYMLRVKPNNKALEIWKQKTGSNDTTQFNWAALTPQDRLEAFRDSKWDFRYPTLPSDNKTSTATKTVRESDKPEIPVGTKGSNSGFDFGRVKFNQPQTGIVFPTNYSRDSITTNPIQPQYVTPRYLDIQPQLNEINRGVNALNMNIGSRTGSDIANLLQAQSNAYNQQNQVFGQKYNYDRGQDQWAEGINAQTKMNIDQFNLNNYIQNARNPQLQREANIQMDKNNRMAEQIAMNTDMLHEQNVMNYLADIYNPDYTTTNLFPTKNSIKKNGGKVKLSKKKKK